MKAALPLHLYTERDWDRQLKQLCDRLGWTLNYHTLRSKGSRSGFPDRILVRERLVAVELKTETGKPTDMQVEWLDGMAAAGVETYLWRPSDLEECGRILSTRWKWNPWTTHNIPGRTLVSPTMTWQPKSLWMKGVGRRDTTRQQTIAGRLAAAGQQEGEA